MAVVALTATVGAPHPALGQTQNLTLVSDYTVLRADNPQPTANAQMGWLGIANAGDLNRDGAADVLVPNYAGPGTIHVFSGANGELIRSLQLPDAATSTAGSAGNFVYPARLGDLASCAGTAANQPCPAIGAADGVPETLVGASGVDIPGAAPDMGRAYVFDGATGALLKKVQMPAADLASEAAQFPAGKSFSFGRAVIAPASPFPANAPAAIGRGDFDGGGKPDFVVGNPTYYEAGPGTNPSCTPGPCPGSGRAYFFRGEDVTGSAATILDTPLRVVKNPAADSDVDHERFGHAFIAVGDVGRCSTSPGAGASCPAGTIVPDGTPDVVVTAHRTRVNTIPAGVTWLVDGATGAILRRFSHPEPQDGALFGYYVGTMSTAIGDAGGSSLPDIYAPAVGQAGSEVGQGRAYVLDGDWTSASPVLTSFDDPTPHRGENFGAPASGIGNVTGDARNEILIGVAGPWTPGDDRTYLGQVLVVEPVTGAVRLTLQDPDQQVGSGFGQGAVQIGDVNQDGAMDFAAEAGYWTGPTMRAGRLYIFHSVNPKAPAPAPGPASQSPIPTLVADTLPALFPRCPAAAGTVNVVRASAAGGPVTGTAGPDHIFGSAGRDVVDALAGDDCADLGAGADQGKGGPGGDLMLGGLGNDDVSGDAGPDRLRGGPGADRLGGGAGNDVVEGGAGKDRISAGAGNDRISAGAGADQVEARDGRGRDRVACGGGRDTVVADRGDRVARDCERVSRK